MNTYPSISVFNSAENQPSEWKRKIVTSLATLAALSGAFSLSAADNAPADAKPLQIGNTTFVTPNLAKCEKPRPTNFERLECAAGRIATVTSLAPIVYAGEGQGSFNLTDLSLPGFTWQYSNDATPGQINSGIEIVKPLDNYQLVFIHAHENWHVKQYGIYGQQMKRDLAAQKTLPYETEADIKGAEVAAEVFECQHKDTLIRLVVKTPKGAEASHGDGEKRAHSIEKGYENVGCAV